MDRFLNSASRQHQAADGPRKGHDLNWPAARLDPLDADAARDGDRRDLERSKDVDAGGAAGGHRNVVVAGHDADVDAGRRQALDPLRELALMRRRGVARLVDIPGEDDQVDAGFDRAIDGLVERLEEIVQALIQTRSRD